MIDFGDLLPENPVSLIVNFLVMRCNSDNLEDVFGDGIAR